MDRGIDILEMGYSINIKNDFDNNHKMSSYIPTEKNSKLLEKLILGISKNINNSYLLSGAYGSGKSFFLSVLLNLLTNKNDLEKNKLINKIEEKYSIKSTYKNIENKNYLTVFIDDKFEGYEKGLVIGVLEAIKNNNLNIKLNNEFNVIINKIETWKKNQKEIVDKVEKELNMYNITLDKYLKELKAYNEKYLEIFTKIYEKIFYGEKFINLECRLGIQEFLTDFENKIIQSKKYSGVIYIFDEFGRYLESNINTIDVKEIQDMAEYCNNENNSYLFLITHKDIFQYANKLNKDDNKLEWEKVSGRFQKEYLNYEKLTSLDIVAESMKKNKDFIKYKNDNKELFDKYFDLIKDSKISSEISQVIGEKFYPLNYLSAQILPDLSQKIAQNERTMFAFISSGEGRSLKNILKNEFIISLDRLYDYFEENFKFLKSESLEYKSYINGKNIISKLKKDIEKKIIKAITLLYIYNKFAEIEPTKEIIKLAVGINSEDFEKSLKTLQEKNYIAYKRNFNHFKIVEDNEINIEKDIKEYIKNKTINNNYTELLNKYLPCDIYYPLKYNSEKDITRYFNCYYLDISNIDDIDTIIETKISDGTIIYLTNIEKNEKYKLLEPIMKNKDIILIKNKNFKKINIGNFLKELEAIDCLILSGGKYNEGIIKSELLLYKNEIQDILKEELNRYFIKENREVFLNNNKFIEKDLLKITNNYLEKKYYNYKELNYELINKMSLSVPMKKVRITLFDMLLKNDEKLFEGDFYEGTGAINSVARILLKKYRFLNDNEINFINDYEEVYNEIDKKIRVKEVLIKDIYDDYCSEKLGYGFRKGLFTYILGFIFIKNKNIFSINDLENKNKLLLQGELIEKIEKNPEKYTISYVELNEEQEKYLRSLKKIFNNFMLNDDISEEAILEGFRNYFYSLPRLAINLYLKETKVLSKIMLNIFKDKNAYEFIFKEVLIRCKADEFLKVIKILEEEIDFIEKKIRNVSVELEKIIIENLSNTNSVSVSDALEEWREESKIVTNSFENWLKKYEFKNKNKFILDITEKVKGFNYENWISQKDLEDFKIRLKNNLKHKNTSVIKENIVEVKLDNNIMNIEIIEKNSSIGKMLKIKIESVIKSMGLAVSEKEKKSILIEILKEM